MLNIGLARHINLTGNALRFLLAPVRIRALPIFAGLPTANVQVICNAAALLRNGPKESTTDPRNPDAWLVAGGYI
jgi:hypothetical protein